MKTLKELEKQAVVFVEYVSNNYNFFGNRLYGSYYRWASPKPYIEINKDCPKEMQRATLIHENTHAKCHAKNCKCQNNKALSEYHAFRETLIQSLKEKDINALRLTIEQIEGLAEWTDYYGKACRKIMKLRLWQKCKMFVANSR